MGVDLTNAAGEEFHFSNFSWRCLMAFAESKGWRNSIEDADRFSNSDANDFTDILEEHLTGMSTQNLSAEFTRILVEPSDSQMFSNEPIKVSDAGLDHLRKFIEFARRGAFDILY